MSVVWCIAYGYTPVLLSGRVLRDSKSILSTDILSREAGPGSLSWCSRYCYLSPAPSELHQVRKVVTSIGADRRVSTVFLKVREVCDRVLVSLEGVLCGNPTVQTFLSSRLT